uniref:Uncharacterized protein n=1 Tax=Arundo donax TaxID=35708 RepID=A0A0A9BSI6_ARUDO
MRDNDLDDDDGDLELEGDEGICNGDGFEIVDSIATVAGSRAESAEVDDGGQLRPRRRRGDQSPSGTTSTMCFVVVAPSVARAFVLGTPVCMCGVVHAAIFGASAAGQFCAWPPSRSVVVILFTFYCSDRTVDTT